MNEQTEFVHVPVMLNEVIESLKIKENGIYVDGTAGGGGHSFAIGSLLGKSGYLICVDRDPEAIERCSKKTASLECKKEIIHSEFSRIPAIANERKILIDGLLLDLGVSSFQLDEADRGFSYRFDAPLDMRMNPESGISAYDIVNTYTAEQLNTIFFEYGEERYSRRIADAVCSARKEKPIATTFELSEIIKCAMPGKALREKQHPAKRVFQAIRIAVNDELGQITSVLENIIPCMALGGRIAIITFHSLEDRIVKKAFVRFANPCTCQNLPICVCGKKPAGKIVANLVPSETETASNFRAHSARLRVFERNETEITFPF